MHTNASVNHESCMDACDGRTTNVSPRPGLISERLPQWTHRRARCLPEYTGAPRCHAGSFNNRIAQTSFIESS